MEGYEFSGFNYKFEKVYIKHVDTKIFDTNDELMIYMDENEIEIYNVYERDGKHYLEISEGKIVPVEQGEMVSLYEMLAHALIMEGTYEECEDLLNSMIGE